MKKLIESKSTWDVECWDVDGIEMYYVRNSGDLNEVVGMTCSGLARACGISEGSVRSYELKNKSKYIDFKEDLVRNNIRLLRTSMCYNIIEHFATGVKNPKRKALETYKKIMKPGLLKFFNTTKKECIDE